MAAASAPQKQAPPTAADFEPEDEGDFSNLFTTLPDALQVVLLGTFVASINIVLLLAAITATLLWMRGPLDPLGLLMAGLLVTLGWLPTKYSHGPLMRGFVRMVTTKCQQYFPVTVTLEEPETLHAGQSYILALEPHSCLPLSIPSVFAPGSPLLPAFLRGRVHGLASSACFVVPIIKQLWWALGLRPVGKAFIERMLSTGKSVVLCPGGVQECLYMQHGNETLFLTKRLGFVRMAMQHNVPIVPVFVFGQSNTYSWWRPGPDKFIRWLSRQIGVVPMAVWGRWGTPVPHKQAMHMVIGKPFVVPHLATPSTEQVAEYLGRFIDEVKALVERNKARCGAPDLVLRVL